MIRTFSHERVASNGSTDSGTSSTRSRSSSTSSAHSPTLRKKRSQQMLERIRPRPPTPRFDSYESEPDFGCRDRNNPEMGLYRNDVVWRLLGGLAPPSPPWPPRLLEVSLSPWGSPRSSVSSPTRSESFYTASPTVAASLRDDLSPLPRVLPLPPATMPPWPPPAPPPSYAQPSSAAQLEGLARKQDFAVRATMLSDEQRLRLYAALDAEQVEAFCEAFDIDVDEPPLGPLRATCAQLAQGSYDQLMLAMACRPLRRVLTDIWQQPDGDQQLLRFLRYALAHDISLAKPPAHWPSVPYAQLKALAMQLQLTYEQARALCELRSSEA